MPERVIWSGSTTLPTPTEIKVDNEIIWSSNTGRSAEGYMIGDVVAEKKTLNITWAFITAAELATIESVMAAGFFTLSFEDGGTEVTIEAYRGTLSKTRMGTLDDGETWYRSVGVTVIQR